MAAAVGRCSDAAGVAAVGRRSDADMRSESDADRRIEDRMRIG